MAWSTPRSLLSCPHGQGWNLEVLHHGHIFKMQEFSCTGLFMGSTGLGQLWTTHLRCLFGQASGEPSGATPGLVQRPLLISLVGQGIPVGFIIKQVWTQVFESHLSWSLSGSNSQNTFNVSLSLHAECFTNSFCFLLNLLNKSCHYYQYMQYRFILTPLLPPWISHVLKGI